MKKNLKPPNDASSRKSDPQERKGLYQRMMSSPCRSKSNGFVLPPRLDTTCGEVFRSIGRDAVWIGFARKENEPVDWGGGTFPLFSLSLVLRGRGVYTDWNGTEYMLEPGKVFFRLPGFEHTTMIDPDSHWLEFYIAFHFMSPIDYVPAEEEDTIQFSQMVAETRPGMLKLKDVPDQDDRWVYSMCRHIFGVDQFGPVRDIGLTQELLNQCVEFMYNLRSAGDGYQVPILALMQVNLILNSRKRDKKDSICDAVKQIIEQNILDPRPLPVLLKDLPVSYSSLRRNFIRVNGYAIGEYQIHCRMEKAIAMLRGGASVKETAEALGYKTQFFFSKQFHEQVGFPPSVLKK